MKDQKDIFNVDPSHEHLNKVQAAVDPILKRKRQERRRRLWTWFLVPAFASVASIFVSGNLLKKTNGKKETLFLAEFEWLNDLESESDLEMIADLEVLEDLEFLEVWDGSEEA